MVNEKIIDYGSFIVAALISAFLYLQPQILQAYGADPNVAILIVFVGLVLSQIGSRIAVNMSKAEVPVEVQEELQAVLTKNKELASQIAEAPEEGA